MRTGRISRVLISVGAGLAVGTVGLAAPAWAHVEVSADKAQAGATDATVTIDAEAHSGSAGIASVRVTLPAGIPPAQVRLATGPTGWTMSTEADAFTVAGPALPVGTDAVFSFVIDQVPYDATELVFKTILTYTDGTPERWIDETVAGQPAPQHPAPILKLAPAPSGPPPTTTPPAPTTENPSPPVNPAAPPSDDGGSNTALLLGGAAAAIAAAAAVVFLLRRRGTPPSGEGGAPS